ncbi:hypothetical protein [Streptomyces gardneri]|uniref:hypothetical protein n=1 Tax=Streptomyces gardneri TaxID=66892 RepID=UPI003409CC68
MWPFPRHQHQPSPESEIAKRAAERSLHEAQARLPEAEAKLNEYRQVRDQLRAHNRAEVYSAFSESIVLGRLTG